MSKRQKFVIATLILTLGIVLIRYPMFQWRYRVLVYLVIDWALSLWALHDRDFGGVEWVTLLILPTMFSLGGALVFPLLPRSFDSFLIWNISPDSGLLLGLGIRMAFLLLFAVGYYAVLLTRNIYNVAAIRTIQLLRAAHSVGFMMVLLTALSLFLVTASFHLSSFWNFCFIFIISLPLALSALWSINLEEGINRQLRLMTVFMALAVAEVGWIMSFWPVSVSLYALVLTTVFYTLVGMGQYYLSERLFGNTSREFVAVLVIIFILMIFTTSWSG